jgi:hypothetical protein
MNRLLQVGPPIQHEESASPYGKVAGLKYLLLPDIADGKLPMNRRARHVTWHPAILPRRVPPRFFDDIPLCCLVSIILPPITFSHPLQGVRARSSPAFHPSFVTLTLTPAKQPILNQPRGKESYLVAVLALSKSLQYRTKRPCLSLPGQNKSSNREANRIVRGHLSLLLPQHPQHNLLQIVALVLLHQMQ